MAIETKSKQSNKAWFSRAKEWVSSSRLRALAVGVTVLAVVGLLVLEVILKGDQGFLKEFLERLWEALLIAGLISLLLDGVAKADIANSAAQKVNQEWQRLSNEGLWVLLNHDAWPAHKDWVMAMAQKKTFLGQGNWHVTLSDDGELDDLLHLSVEFEGHGQTFDKAGTFPYGNSPLLASSDGRNSRHLGYHLIHIDKKGRHKPIIEAEEDLINDPANGLIETRGDGAVLLGVDRLRSDFSKDDQRFQPEDKFTLRHKAEVYRHRRGFFPMWTPWISCETSVKVTNQSSVDLELTLARLDQLQVHTLRSGVAQAIDLLPPGSAFILSWSDKAANEALAAESAAN